MKRGNIIEKTVRTDMKKIIASYMILFILVLAMGIRSLNAYAAEPITIEGELFKEMPKLDGIILENSFHSI